jgi:hypothetical protein
MIASRFGFIVPVKLRAVAPPCEMDRDDVCPCVCSCCASDDKEGAQHVCSLSRSDEEIGSHLVHIVSEVVRLLTESFITWDLVQIKTLLIADLCLCFFVSYPTTQNDLTPVCSLVIASPHTTSRSSVSKSFFFGPSFLLTVSVSNAPPCRLSSYLGPIFQGFLPFPLQITHRLLMALQSHAISPSSLPFRMLNTVSELIA